jgi:diaminopimelate decarboxylase
MNHVIGPEAWGLHAFPGGELAIGNHGLTGLAEEYGTPLHIIHENLLMKNAGAFRKAVLRSYPGRSSVFYAMKCNSVPAVVDAVLREGTGLEVMTEYELLLALHLGCPGSNIIVNGPCKTPAFLDRCIDAGVRFVIVDSIPEMHTLNARSLSRGARTEVLFRVNPDYTPQGMNRGTATGSRRGCAFGLDLRGGEVESAMDELARLPGIRFTGFHLHIGTGVRNPADYARALRCLDTLKKCAAGGGRRVQVIDVGGGFAAPLTREFGTKEFLLYQALGILPGPPGENACPAPEVFASAIAEAVGRSFTADELPELICEPGRCIASPAQFLLLTVHYVKDRPGAGRWLIADGGLSTVTLPTFYEYHEIFLCNDVTRPRTVRSTITGPACFAGDVIYRNKLMPDVLPGDVLALMDTGAYFTAMESSFGFARPAIAAVNGASCRLVRARETFDDMVARDVID